MLQPISSNVLCYTDDTPIFEMLQKALPDYSLKQVKSLAATQSELESNHSSLLIFDASNSSLALKELMEALAEAKTARVIVFDSQGQRQEALSQFELGVQDVINSEELNLLPFIVKREMQSAACDESPEAKPAPSKPAVSTQKADSTALKSKPEAAKESPKTAPPSPPKPQGANTTKPALSKQELDEMITLLKVAIKENKFQMLFQPLIQLGGDDTEFYEVLLRLPKEDGSLMSAGLFMNEPQVPDDIKKNIDRWVIAKAMKLLSSHLNKGGKARMFINLCSSSLADPKLASYILEQIEEHNISKESIIFQFNEEDASSIEKEAVAFSNSLNNSFIPMSLSRFGMQPESMELCNKINPLFVKLNGYFSKNIQKDAALKASTEELLNKLKGNYKITIMPMVEDVATVSALWKMGTDFVQGFYVQAPVSGVSFDFSD